MGHVCDQPLVDGGVGTESPTKMKLKFMVSLESFKRIFMKKVCVLYFVVTFLLIACRDQSD
jgi:hypothetical protein